MRFVSVRDFRIRPREVWAQARDQDLVITSSGRPVGILARVEAEDLEETLVLLRRVRAQMAVSRMRKAALATGTDRMAPDDIEAEIQQARAGRQRG